MDADYRASSRPVQLSSQHTFRLSVGQAAEVGLLEKEIDEASGLAISRKIPDRMYHINDSDATGRFFITNLMGRNMRKVFVTGFQPKDTEDLAIGSCGPSIDCLFIGDIGDNDRVEKHRASWWRRAPIPGRRRTAAERGGGPTAHDAEQWRYIPTETSTF